MSTVKESVHLNILPVDTLVAVTPKRTYSGTHLSVSKGGELPSAYALALGFAQISPNDLQGGILQAADIVP